MTFRIGYSDTLLVDPQTRDSLDGIGVYTREMRARLVDDPRLAIVPVVMGSRAARAAAPGTFAFRGRLTAAMATSIIVGTPFRGAAALARKIDVYFATDYRVPRLHGTPVCATVFDAIPLSHPEWANPNLRGFRNWILRNCVQWADHVLAISQAMVSEIVEHYRVPENRISVIPLGVDESWFVDEPPERIRRLRAQYALSPGYFLSVGTLQPRKNVERLVDAYARLPAAIRSEHQLVIVGKVGWSASRTVELLRARAPMGVRWLDRVPDGNLRALVQGATAFAFPSLYEGFGLPVIEAFASNTPVITSTTTSLPEVAGDAAALVDPLDTDAIGAALQRVVDDPQWADELRGKGYARARTYTWQACADRTTEVLRELA